MLSYRYAASKIKRNQKNDANEQRLVKYFLFGKSENDFMMKFSKFTRIDGLSKLFVFRKA